MGEGTSVHLAEVDRGNVLGVGVDLLEPESALDLTLDAMREGRPLRISLLAVHGVMGGALHPARREMLNRFELNLTCGQPVRWALNLLDSARLRSRVYGPDFTLALCDRAAGEGLPIFLYGSERKVLDALSRELIQRFPDLGIAGIRPSSFRFVEPDEQERIATEIAESGAKICFVGLGCPRQEAFIDAVAQRAGVPMAGVGGSFEFIAGTKPWAPHWMRNLGLEWAFRLANEPTRLWRRFLLLNPLYVVMVLGQRTGLFRPGPINSRGGRVSEGAVPG